MTTNAQTTSTTERAAVGTGVVMIMEHYWK